MQSAEAVHLDSWVQWTISSSF